MGKNIIIVLLIILVIGEGVYIVRKRSQVSAMTAAQSNAMAISPSPRPKPMFVMKGQKFTDSPLQSKAYLIFPTTDAVSGDAKTAMSGWTMKTTPNSDGSTQVDLLPNEAADIKQSFTVKNGSKLYFIELTLSDDKNDVDHNRGDDIGVLVDANGIVE